MNRTEETYDQMPKIVSADIKKFDNNNYQKIYWIIRIKNQMLVGGLPAYFGKN